MLKDCCETQNFYYLEDCYIQGKNKDVHYQDFQIF